MTLDDPYLAKYPFFSEAEAVLEETDMGAALTNDAVVARATERVVRGVNDERVATLSTTSSPGVFNATESGDLLIELKSYPVARMLVSLIGDFRIINRYARAEARTARIRIEDEVKSGYAEEPSSSLTGTQHISLEDVLTEYDIDATPTTMQSELSRTYLHEFFAQASPTELRAFATAEFKLADAESVLDDATLDRLGPADIYDVLHSNNRNTATMNWYSMAFDSYVEAAVNLNEPRWRLTNRGVEDGRVLVNRRDLFTLIEEAIHQQVSAALPYEVPDEIATLLEEAAPFADATEPPSFWEELPVAPAQVIETPGETDGVAENTYSFTELVQAAIDDENFSYEIDRVEPGLFPPVITRLVDDVRNGANLKHEARFTLVAFFINIGMTEDEIVEMLEVGGSFGEEPTRYQVGHIKQGGTDGDAYTPANYSTLDSWGLEWQKDALEAQVANPLSYYKIKLQDQDDTESQPAEA
jgi:DNA primase large subunit